MVSMHFCTAAVFVPVVMVLVSIPESKSFPAERFVLHDLWSTICRFRGVALSRVAWQARRPPRSGIVANQLEWGNGGPVCLKLRN